MLVKMLLFFSTQKMIPQGVQKKHVSLEIKIKHNKNNTFIIGISKDSLKKHQKFIEKHDLNFILGSDENNNICEKFDVWKEKSMYGKKYMGIERSTFLINTKGVLIKEWRKVKVTNHVADVLSAVNGL